MEESKQLLWDRLQAGDQEALQQLVLVYLPLVRRVAARWGIRLPGYLEQEDLMSYGVLGLMEAINRFDPMRGVEFEQYAVLRVRGAIIDALRQQSWAPRAVWEKMRQWQEAVARLDQAEQPATSKTVAEAMGLEQEQVAQLEADYYRLTIVSLEQTLGIAVNDDQFSLLDTMVDQNSPDPQRIYEDQEFTTVLQQALLTLESNDQMILALSYLEGLTLKEVGSVLGVSESRACQLRGRALARLRLQLQEQWGA